MRGNKKRLIYREVSRKGRKRCRKEYEEKEKEGEREIEGVREASFQYNR